jgi:hypothetical protein
MKLLAGALIFFLTVSFLFPVVIVDAKPAHSPHEDPSSAQSTMDPYSFLSQYAGILSLIANEQYDNASKLTAQLSHITVPPDLSYIINRYNNITQQLIGTLSDLRITLDNATSLLSQNRLSEASQALDTAGVLVSRAQILLGDLQDATTTVSQRLGVFAAPAQSNIRQSYDALQVLLQKLNDLINQYHALLQSSNKQADAIKAKQLDSTQLSIKINPTTIFVGGVATASGVLKGGGQVLQNRVVKILLDGTQIANVNTNSNGQYTEVFNVPYHYVKSMTIQALYAPSSSIDKETYLAGLSPKISINILFNETHLDLTAPKVVYPGLSYIVKGTVTSQDGSPLNQRAVKILIDEKTIRQIETNQFGLFSTENLLSPLTEIGIHSLTVTVDPKGLYAGVSQTANLSVTKVTSELNVNAPSFVFLPSELHISGTVNSISGPLKNAIVKLEFANVTNEVLTTDDGTFNSTMNIPFSTIFAGTQNLKVSVLPAEPWQGSTQKNVAIFALNAVSTAISLAASFSVCGVLYLKFIRSKSKKTKEKMVQDYLEVPQNPASNEVEIPPKAEFKFEGLKGKVLDVYIQALRNIESYNGTSINQNMTLREFLHLTEHSLGKAVYPFTDLTYLAERTLYSTHKPEEQDLLKAKDYVDEIGRILNSENK